MDRVFEILSLHYLLGWLNTPLIPSSKYFLCKGVLAIQSSITCSYQYKLKTHKIFWNFHCIYSVWYTLAIYIKVKLIHEKEWIYKFLPLYFVSLLNIIKEIYINDQNIFHFCLKRESSATFYVQNWMKVPTLPHLKKCCIFSCYFLVRYMNTWQ